MTKDCVVSLLVSSVQEGEISTYRKAGGLTKDFAVSLLSSSVQEGRSSTYRKAG